MQTKEQTALRAQGGDGERAAGMPHVQAHYTMESDAMQALHAVYALILSWPVPTEIEGARAAAGQLVGAADYEPS